MIFYYSNCKISMDFIFGVSEISNAYGAGECLKSNETIMCISLKYDQVALHTNPLLMHLFFWYSVFIPCNENALRTFKPERK